VTYRVLMDEQPPVLAPRFKPRFNQVYRASGYTYVACWFYSGRTGRVRLLVGEAAPPDFSIGDLDAESGNASGVVRPGEYWMLECNRPDGGGFRAMVTPMYEVPDEVTVIRP
jgi:hypothetical protein